MSDRKLDRLVRNLTDAERKAGRLPDVDRAKQFAGELLERAARKPKVPALHREPEPFQMVEGRSVQYGPNGRKLVNRIKRMYIEPGFRGRIQRLAAEKLAVEKCERDGRIPLMYAQQRLQRIEVKYRTLIEESNQRWGHWRNDVDVVEI